MNKAASKCDVNFVAEIECPYCRNRNRYVQLSSVHSNIRNSLNRGNLSIKFDAKCMTCDKIYELDGLRFV